MADNDPKSFSERRQAANADPFAELSRIIGYAPQGGPDAAGQPQPGFADDLEMDMERELLGTFAPEVRPLPTPRFRPAGDVAAAQPAAAAAPDEQPDDPEMDLDDLGIALDLDAELAASLAETARSAADEPVAMAPGEGDIDRSAAANDDVAPLLPVDQGAATPGLDDAALAAMLAAEFDGPAAAPEAVIEDRQAVSGGAAEDPAMAAGEPVAFPEHAGDPAFEVAEEPGLFDDFEAALLRSIDADAGPSAADAALRQGAADEVISLPGDLATWRAEAAVEPHIPEKSVAQHRDVPSVAPASDSIQELAEADFEDELAAAFGADIMAETRSAADARAATQDAFASGPAAVEIDDEPVVVEQPDDLAAVAAAPETPASPVEDEAGKDMADEPAFELDLSELVTAEPEVAAAPVAAEPDHVDAEPALVVRAEEFEASLPAGEQPNAAVEGAVLASEVLPAVLDEAAAGYVDAGPATEVEPAADAFEQAVLADERTDIEEFEPAAVAEAVPAQVVAGETVDNHADLDRSLAASLAAEFADTDLFSDMTLDIDEPAEAAASPGDVPADPTSWQEARAPVATDAAEIDFDAAMAEVDADFSALPMAPEVEARHVEDAAPVAVDTASTLESDLDNLLGEMQAQTAAAARPQPVVAAAVPAADAFDLLASEDLFAQALREAAEDELSQAEFQAEAEAPVPQETVAASPVEAASAEPAPVEPEPEFPPIAAADRETSEWTYGEWNVTRVAAAFSDIPREPEVAATPSAEADRQVTTNAPAAASLAAASAMTAAAAPELPSPTRDDPFAALAAMAARYKRSEPMSTQTGISEFGAAIRQSDVRAAQPAYDEDFGFADEVPRHQDMPDIQTVDVGDGAVALADDLDIPDLLHFEDEPASGNAAYDDLDAEFNSLISDMAGNDPRLARPGAAVDPRQQAAEAHDAPRGYAAAAIAGAMAAQAHDRAAPAPQPVAQAQAPANDTYDPFDDDLPLPAYEAIDPEPQPRRRGFFLASVIGGVALLGGIAAFAFSFGDGGSAVPTLVKADAEPIKVRPENPGGTVVPHQDNKVYQTVAGKSDAALEQHKLLTTAEEPVDIAVPQMADDDAPRADEDGLAPAIAGVETDAAAGKSEDRVLADGADTGTTVEDEVALVQPRKVRTMVVKSDGTLVPREEPAVAAQPVNAEPEQAAAEPDNDATFTIPGAEVAAPAAKATRTAATPVKAPVAPVRPADQPVDIVGGVRADQVASISTGGEWSMQIASQPSQAGAQAEYATLSKRYAKVLKGQPVNIVKAEIAGKGTFWRVRVPADSKAAAAALCDKYKAAGGNCFVSR